MAVARWKEIWVGMVVANFRVLEGADSLELDICVFVEYFVAIFPDIVCVFSECSDGAGNAMLSSISLDDTWTGRMNGSCTGPGRSEKTFHSLMPSNLFLLFESLHQNRLEM